MPAWIQLPAEKAHSFYRVPLELAATDCNYFYGAAHDPRDADGPWPLLAFLRERNRPGVMMFHIYTIEAEELAVEAFNPLAQPCGYLSLDGETLAGLAKVLSSLAAKLTQGPGGVRPMFRQIDESKLADLGLHPDSFPDSNDQYYHQIYDPLAAAGETSNQTIMLFSSGQPSQPSSRFYFKIAQYPQQAVEDPSFDVLDDALPRINLDRGGMEELARLLEAQLVNLAKHI